MKIFSPRLSLTWSPNKCKLCHDKPPAVQVNMNIDATYASINTTKLPRPRDFFEPTSARAIFTQNLDADHESMYAHITFQSFSPLEHQRRESGGPPPHSFQSNLLSLKL